MPCGSFASLCWPCLRKGAAVAGYDTDGMYTAPKNKYEQTRFTPLPTNTGDPLRDRGNEISNQLMEQLLRDPAMESLVRMYDERYGGHGLSDYRDGMDDYMLHEFGRSKYDRGATNVLTSEDAERNRQERADAKLRMVAGCVGAMVAILLVSFVVIARTKSDA